VIAQLPTLLALLGTALTGVAIFAPPHPAAGGPVISFGPPLAPVPWSEPDPFGLPATHGRRPEVWTVDEPALGAGRLAPGVQVEDEPGWPALVDPRAAGCDAAARAGLVEALVAVEAPWAEAILCRAAVEERDPRVGAALATAGYFGAGRP
jgi:hypothetical protein